MRRKIDQDDGTFEREEVLSRGFDTVMEDILSPIDNSEVRYRSSGSISNFSIQMFIFSIWKPKISKSPRATVSLQCSTFRK